VPNLPAPKSCRSYRWGASATETSTPTKYLTCYWTTKGPPCWSPAAIASLAPAIYSDLVDTKPTQLTPLMRTKRQWRLPNTCWVKPPIKTTNSSQSRSSNAEESGGRDTARKLQLLLVEFVERFEPPVSWTSAFHRYGIENIWGYRVDGVIYMVRYSQHYHHRHEDLSHSHHFEKKTWTPWCTQNLDAIVDLYVTFYEHEP